MKKLFFFFFLFLVAGLTTFAQAPQAFNYQGVARNNNGAILKNRPIALRISIIKGSTNSTTAYTEIHNVTTDKLGIFDLAIGAGQPTLGTFSSIEWGVGTYFLQLEIDANGGYNFELAGTTQLLSVPYALYAAQSGTGGTSQWSNNSTGINYNGGNVGIGTSEPNSILDVVQDGLTFEVKYDAPTNPDLDSYVSQVRIGNSNNPSIVGLVFDAMDGDFKGLDYGSLYQFEDGKIELHNRSDNPITFAINRDNKVTITPQGDVFVDNPGLGIILKSPNGACWRMSVTNSGQSQFTSVTCPQ